MKLLITLFLAAIAGAFATCGTSGGSGCVPCVNNPNYCCTNCGVDPCAGADGMCWSCSGSNGMCYAYDCGTYCSTAPCVAEKDTKFYTIHQKKLAAPADKLFEPSVAIPDDIKYYQQQIEKVVKKDVSDFPCGSGTCSGSGTCCPPCPACCCPVAGATCCGGSGCCPPSYPICAGNGKCAPSADALADASTWVDGLKLGKCANETRTE